MSDADCSDEPGAAEHQAASLLAYTLAALEKSAGSCASLRMLKKAITAEMDQFDGFAGDLIKIAREAASPSELAGPLRRQKPRQRGHLRVVPPTGEASLASRLL